MTSSSNIGTGTEGRSIWVPHLREPSRLSSLEQPRSSAGRLCRWRSRSICQPQVRGKVRRWFLRGLPLSDRIFDPLRRQDTFWVVGHWRGTVKGSKRPRAGVIDALGLTRLRLALDRVGATGVVGRAVGGVGGPGLVGVAIGLRLGQTRHGTEGRNPRPRFDATQQSWLEVGVGPGTLIVIVPGRRHYRRTTFTSTFPDC